MCQWVFGGLLLVGGCVGWVLVLTVGADFAVTSLPFCLVSLVEIGTCPDDATVREGYALGQPAPAEAAAPPIGAAVR